MNARSRKLSVAVTIILIGLGIGVSVLFRQAKAAADDSAHAALTAEIVDRLGEISDGKPYPSSLSQLALTFPEGGDKSLLSRFTYSSSGTNCIVTTQLRGKIIVRSFP